LKIDLIYQNVLEKCRFYKHSEYRNNMDYYMLVLELED